MSKRIAVAAVSLLVASGCAAGAPPGFSEGKVWSVPMVGPLENGMVVVPVKVNDTGPYLFMVDPDSVASSVDTALASELELYTRIGAKELVDESDTQRVVRQAEVGSLAIGDLTVSNKIIHLHKPGTYYVGGRLIRGLLGRDIIADSLIVAVDRDRGRMHLATQGNMAPPPNSTQIEGDPYYGRFLVEAKFNEQHGQTLHFDLGAPWTMVWDKRARKANLPRVNVRARLVDELGTARDIDHGWMVAKLAVGEARVDGTLVLPFGDRRVRERDFDGALGMNFLSQFNVTLNRHQQRVWLKPRVTDLGELAGQRMQRWGNALDKCKTPACVEVRVAPTQDGTIAIELAREPWTLEFSYEVYVEPLSAEGTPLGLPLLRATFQTGAQRVVAANAEPYAAAAQFRVVDMSPFPRDCDPGAPPKCVWTLQLQR